MRESRLSGSVEGVLRNPDPYSDSGGVEANTPNLLQKGRPFILRRIIGMWLLPVFRKPLRVGSRKRLKLHEGN